MMMIVHLILLIRVASMAPNASPPLTVYLGGRLKSLLFFELAVKSLGLLVIVGLAKVCELVF